MSKDIVTKDTRGREIIRVNAGGRLLVSRYPDLDENTKNYIIDVCSKVTTKDPKKLRDFLDYKSDENEFCS